MCCHKRRRSTKQKRTEKSQPNENLGDLDGGDVGLGFYAPVIIMDGDGCLFEDICCCL